MIVLPKVKTLKKSISIDVPPPPAPPPLLGSVAWLILLPLSLELGSQSVTCHKLSCSVCLTQSLQPCFAACPPNAYVCLTLFTFLSIPRLPVSVVGICKPDSLGSLFSRLFVSFTPPLHASVASHPPFLTVTNQCKGQSTQRGITVR